MARRKTIDELKADSIKYEQKAKAAKEALEKEIRLDCGGVPRGGSLPWQV